MSNKKSNSTNMTTFNEADRRKILESLTADELATFQEAFTVFDKNQDGTITTKVSTPTNSYSNSLSKCFLENLAKSPNYPILFGYFRDLAKFSWILHKYIFFNRLCFFLKKIWQCLTLCSNQSKRLIIAKCYIKWLCSDIILCSWEKYRHLELSK